MLKLVRTELKEDISGLRSEMKSEFNRVGARFMQVDSKLQDVLTAVHGVAAEVARVGMLVEEQNSRNRVALEAVSGLNQRQDRVEARMDETESLVRSIALGIRKS